MPQTKAQPKKAAATAHRRAPAKGTGTRFDAGVDRTTELSEEVLASIESGQRAAIEAVRKFVDKIDEAMPLGEGPSKREEVVDSALNMAERLVKVQYDFLRSVVHSAGKSLGAPHEGKK